jgi:tetratricopeptide (TPR) repeat protein
MHEQQRLDEARELLRTGWYEAASARLEGCEDWAVPLRETAMAVKAEIALRHDPIAALEMLARVNDLFTTAQGRYTYHVISGKAYANARNFDSAAQMFDRAEEHAGGEARRAAEIAHHRARLRYLSGEFEPDHHDFSVALGHPEPGARLMTLIVRSWMHGGLGEYAEQVADLRAAVALAREHPQAMDLYSLGRALHSLLRLAVEIGDVQAIRDAEALFESIEWTPDLCDAQFLSLRALAWGAFLRGETARAQWLFRDSMAVAPNDAWRVTAHVDRAYVARIGGNEAWALDEIAHAAELARQIVWAATVDEERQALVTLAVLLAPVDMGQAQRYVSTYMRLGTQSVDPSLAIAHDRRAEGFAQYAWGRVHQVLGNTPSSTSAYETAYRIFSEAGHHFRAALAAVGMSEVTGLPLWRERAREHASHYPQSAFYRYLQEAIERPAAPEVDGLTPLRVQLAVALCNGFDAAELSQRFSRSEFTIKREIRGLYEALGVKSRAALRDALRERGIR